ncbi:MAG TPA: winged helix-turn-helix transcriptional regulator [Phycisphaerales bacterium]|nr:winged helix-turn-helix transcriptional regulator [Phycisphaerales bacterium]
MSDVPRQPASPLAAPESDARAPIGQALRLAAIFRRRWRLPILAQLHNESGSRFVTLAHRLGASEGALRVTLDDLIADGLITSNPGYGHPLRPEYILTAKGAALAPACARVDAIICRLDLRPVALRRWSMPALFAVGRGPTRFTQVADLLAGATDRAVSMALKDLAAAGVVERRVEDAFPPATVYRASKAGRLLVPALADL